MDDVRKIDEGPPAPVAIAAMFGFAKAIFETSFGVLGFAVADSVDDAFSGALVAFGVVFAIASLLLLRGSRAGYYLTVALSVLGLAVAVVYFSGSEGTTGGASLMVAFFNALVLYLLLGRKSAREYFAR